nr:unnamed protein product [Mus musculus]
MFSRLSNLFRRASVDGREARERREDAGLPSESNEGTRKWTGRMWKSRQESRLFHRYSKQTTSRNKELCLNLWCLEGRSKYGCFSPALRGEQDDHGTHRQTSSTAPDLSKNEFKKEKERLTTELHFITQKRNEQRDHLIAFKEGSMNKRSQRLQQELKFPHPRKRASCRMSFHLRSPLLNSIPNIHSLPWMNLITFSTFSRCE